MVARPEDEIAGFGRLQRRRRVRCGGVSILPRMQRSAERGHCRYDRGDAADDPRENLQRARDLAPEATAILAAIIFAAAAVQTHALRLNLGHGTVMSGFDLVLMR